MTAPLNYQARNSAIYYTPPSRVNVGRALAGSLVAAILIVIGSVCYAKIQPAMGNIYVRAGQVFVGAFAVGALTIIPVRYGKIRIPLLAASIGAALSMLAVYVMWLTWAHDYFQHGLPIGYGILLKHPRVLIHLIGLINEIGAWTFRGDVIRGIPLTICWLAEFAAILACGVMLPIKAIGDVEAVCTSCGSPCKLVRPIARFSQERQADLVSAVENHEFDAIASHAPPEDERSPQLSLRLLSCMQCEQTNVLTVNHISWTATQSGRKMNIRPIVNQLLIPPQEAESLKKLLQTIMDRRNTEPSQQNESPPLAENLESATGSTSPQPHHLVNQELEGNGPSNAGA